MKKVFLLASMMLCLTSAAHALEKDEILVVYNQTSPGAKELAAYYVAKRDIPAEHVLAIRTVLTERIKRPAYLDTIQKPIKQWIDDSGEYKKIRCILLMRGVPLEIQPIEDEKTYRPYAQARDAVRPVAAEKERLLAEKTRLEEEAKRFPARAAKIDQELQALGAKIAEVEIKLKALEQKRDRAKRAFDNVTAHTNASVDSELAVMYMPQRRVKGWVANMLAHRTWKRPGREKLPRTFMTCRLDGASDALVRRMIDDAVAVEKTGLRGVAYFDARGMHVAPGGNVSAYARWDEKVRQAAAMVEKTGMKTVLDDRGFEFAPDTCPDAAIYCGWYSLAKYVPAFKWARGSVGYHIASAEALTLRDGGKPVWCKRMIDEGIAATFGPVAEPYLQSFPDPSDFFAFLLTGRYTVLEAFWYSKPMNSWKLTLIGDPLYAPFKRNPRMTIAQLKEVLGN